MRAVWVVALLIPLSGCTVPGGGEPDVCDHASWSQGVNTAVVQNSWPRTGIRTNAEKEDTLGAGSLTFRGRELDRVELDFHWEEQNGTFRYRGVLANEGSLTARFFDDQGSPLRAFAGGAADEAKHEWTWTDTEQTNFTLTVQLEPDATPPDARPVVVQWVFNGFPMDPEEPEDVALAWYEATLWYRTCTPGEPRVQPTNGTVRTTS